MDPLKVTPMGMDAEFGFVVRGTTDPTAAATAVLEHRLAHPIDEDFESASCGLTDEDLRGRPDVVERASRPLPVHRVGLFRWNPCNRHACGEQHDGHLVEVETPGPGVWPGVWLGEYPLG